MMLTCAAFLCMLQVDEADGGHIEVTLAASLESKDIGAVRNLVQQLEALSAVGLDVCHVKGADCWKADVACLKVGSITALTLS